MDDKHEPAGSPKGGQFANKGNAVMNEAIRKGATKPKKFISEGYGQYQSSGEVYEYEQVASETDSLDTLANGDPKKKFIVKYQGQEIGTVQNYSAYLDSRTAGRRYVNTRKNVARWRYSLNSGFHAQSYGIGANQPIIPGVFDEMGFRSFKEAMQSLADTHKRVLK